MVVIVIFPAQMSYRYLVYLTCELFVPLFLVSFWYLMLLLQLGSVVHTPLLVPPPGMHKVRSAGCLRLICITAASLGVSLSRFLESALYKCLNE